MNDFNRALVALGSRLAAQEQVGEELKDIRKHWAEWRLEWEHKLAQNEIQFLRGVADLQAGFQHRATLMDANYRDAMRGQHAEFTGALERFALDIQKRLWADLERIRLDYERLIYSELQTIRQRAAVSGVSRGGGPARGAGAAAVAADSITARFAERFRGTEEYVKAGPAVLPALLPRAAAMCWISAAAAANSWSMMRDAGVPAQRHRSRARSRWRRAATRAWTPRSRTCSCIWTNLPEASLDGIFCSQVVEHLPPDRLPEMVRLCASRLAAQRRDRHRDAQPGVPGDLRHALLSGPDASAPGAAPAAGVLPGGIRRGQYRSAQALAGGGLDALGGELCRRISARRSSAAWTTPFWARSYSEAISAGRSSGGREALSTFRR